MKNNKGHILSRVEGFTLIEMLVVIAIVGLLSSVVLVALGPSRNKAKDARIVSDINQARALIETRYDLVQGKYVYAAADFTSLSSDVSNNGGSLVIQPTPPASSNVYAISSSLNGGGFYCVDSTGKVGSSAASGNACP